MTLFAFGGSGPAHAVDVAVLLGITKVIVPVMSGVFSAVGMLGADVEHNLVQNLFRALDQLETVEVVDVIQHLRHEGALRLYNDGFDQSNFDMRFSADMHYMGQSSELTVDFDPIEIERKGPESLSTAFHAAYLETYGYENNEPVELVSIRLSALGVRQQRLAFAEGNAGVGGGEATGAMREVWFESSHELMSAMIYPRSVVDTEAITGPAILETYDTTIVVPPRCVAHNDACGSVVIDIAPELTGDAA
jgi:N-methylhydantoinase A